MSFATVDGLQIAYCDSGSGGLPVVCLTGWCSSRARYDLLAPLLARRGRVLSIDWRAHGESATPAGDFGHEEMVRDALGVIGEAGLKEFALVASSHAGWVAIELRRRLGERIPAVIHMDWLVFRPSERYIDVIRQLEGSDSWQEGRDTLFEIWRGGIADEGVEAALAVMSGHGAEMWRRSGREIGASFRAGGSPLEAYAAMAERPRVMHLYGQPREEAYLQRQQEFAAANDWFGVRRLAACSHFTMIETASEAAEAVGRFLAEQAPAASA